MKSKSVCKRISNSADTVGTVIFSFYKPSLSPWPWKQEPNFFTWHSAPQWCTATPSLVTKDRVFRRYLLDKDGYTGSQEILVPLGHPNHPYCHTPLPQSHLLSPTHTPITLTVTHPHPNHSVTHPQPNHSYCHPPTPQSLLLSHTHTPITLTVTYPHPNHSYCHTPTP